MSDQPRDRAEALASGLWRRLRDVILVAERIEDYAFAPDPDAPKRPALRSGDAERIALDLTVRAFRLATDATNWRILAAAASSERGMPVAELVDLCGLPRLGVTERANELIQAGLCVRAIDADSILVTEAGEALAALVTEVASTLAQRAEAATKRGEATNGERPLPMV